MRALVAVAVFGSSCLLAPALAHGQCQTNQHACTTWVPTNVSRIFTVPATTSAVSANLPMRQGMRYRIAATGVIRVGMPFEGDTLPDGWFTQDVAGSGFPAPDAYKFSLIVRVGQNGTWRSVGSGVTTIGLSASDPNPSQMFFGINDNRLSDNTGGFSVTVVELAPNSTCCLNQNTPPTNPAWGIILRRQPGGGGRRPKPVPPCGGAAQSFMFDVYCFSSYSRTIPVEACTREEAFELALSFVGYPCYLNEIKGKPVPIDIKDPGQKSLCATSVFKFCLQCGETSVTAFGSGCTADEASKEVLSGRPSICTVANRGDCAR